MHVGTVAHFDQISTHSSLGKGRRVCNVRPDESDIPVVKKRAGLICPTCPFLSSRREGMKDHQPFLSYLAYEGMPTKWEVQDEMQSW